MVIQWNCAACPQIVKAELDTIVDEIKEKGFKGCKGFKGKGSVCTQCLHWIETPLVVNRCPECDAPVHIECIEQQQPTESVSTRASARSRTTRAFR